MRKTSQNLEITGIKETQIIDLNNFYLEDQRRNENNFAETYCFNGFSMSQEDYNQILSSEIYKKQEREIKDGHNEKMKRIKENDEQIKKIMSIIGEPESEFPIDKTKIVSMKLSYEMSHPLPHQKHFQKLNQIISSEANRNRREFEISSTYNPLYFALILKEQKLKYHMDLEFHTDHDFFGLFEPQDFLEKINRFLEECYFKRIETVSLIRFFHQLNQSCFHYFNCDIYSFILDPFSFVYKIISKLENVGLFFEIFESKELGIRSNRINMRTQDVRKTYILNRLRLHNEIEHMEFTEIIDFPDFEPLEIKSIENWVDYSNFDDLFVSKFIILNYFKHNPDLNNCIDESFKILNFESFTGFETNDVENILIRFRSLVRPILIFRCFLLFLFDLSINSFLTDKNLLILNLLILFVFILGLTDPIFFRIKLFYRNKEVNLPNNCYKIAYNKCMYFKCGSIILSNNSNSLDLHAEWDLCDEQGIPPLNKISVPKNSHGYEFIGNIISRQYVINGHYIVDEYNDNISLSEPHIYLLPINYSQLQKNAIMDCVYLVFKEKILFRGTFIDFGCKGNMRNTISKAIIVYCRSKGWNNPYMMKEDKKSHTKACIEFAKRMDYYLECDEDDLNLDDTGDIRREVSIVEEEIKVLRDVDIKDYEEWHVTLPLIDVKTNKVKNFEEEMRVNELNLMASEDGYLSPNEYLQYKIRKKRYPNANFKTYEAEMWSRNTSTTREMASKRRNFATQKENFDKYRKPREKFELPKKEKEPNLGTVKYVFFRHPDLSKKTKLPINFNYNKLNYEQEEIEKIKNLEVPGVFLEKDKEKALEKVSSWKKVVRYKKTQIIGEEDDLLKVSIKKLEDKEFFAKVQNRYQPLMNYYGKLKKRSIESSEKNKKVDQLIKEMLNSETAKSKIIKGDGINKILKQKAKKIKVKIGRMEAMAYKLSKLLEKKIAKASESEKKQKKKKRIDLMMIKSNLKEDEMQKIILYKRIRKSTRAYNLDQVFDKFTIGELKNIGNIDVSYFTKKEIDSRRGLRKIMKNLCRFSF